MHRHENAALTQGAAITVGAVLVAATAWGALLVGNDGFGIAGLLGMLIALIAVATLISYAGRVHSGPRMGP